MDQRDWQVKKTKPMCAEYILENNLYCDVEFKVGEEEELIKAHKLILAQRSPVFDIMFFSSLAETKSPIVIPDVDPSGFKSLLKYCYYECLDVDPKDALSTLYAAKKYILPLLEDHCNEVQIKNLSGDNIWEVYEHCLTYREEKIFEGCQRFFGKSIMAATAALQSPSFLDIPKEILREVLQLKNKDVNNKQLYGITIAEIELFKACNAWANAECLREGLEPSGPNKRLVLGDCLFMMCLPTINLEDLVNIVFPTGILDHEERYNLLEQRYKNDPYKSLKFPSRHPEYNVQFNVGGEGELYEAYTVFANQVLEYSVLELVPKQRMLLTGIIAKNVCEDTAPTKHELDIIENSNENAWCKTVVSQVVESSDHSLQFEAIPLKANAKYCIKVQVVRVISNDDIEYDTVNWKSLYHSNYTPASLNIDVTKSATNCHILGLIFRLF